MLAGAALDLLFLGQEALDVGIDLGQDRLGLRRLARLGPFLGDGGDEAVAAGIGAGDGGEARPCSPSSGRRRPPPAEMMRRGRPWPDVSPTAMAASRLILSSVEIL